MEVVSPAGLEPATPGLGRRGSKLAPRALFSWDLRGSADPAGYRNRGPSGCTVARATTPSPCSGRVALSCAAMSVEIHESHHVVLRGEPFDAIVELGQGWDMEYHQLEAGKNPSDMIQRRLDGVDVAWERLTRTVLITGSPPPDSITFGLRAMTGRGLGVPGPGGGCQHALPGSTRGGVGSAPPRRSAQLRGAP